MANVPGLPADVYFGSVGKPLPDWRRTIGPSGPDDDEPSDDERKAVAAILGFDPREIDEMPEPERRTAYCEGDAPCSCAACQASKPATPPRRLRLLKGANGRMRIMYARATPLRQVNGRLVSHRNKSGDPKCSHAVSQWKRKQATPETFKTLAHCRSLAQSNAMARRHRAAGNEARAQVLESRVARGKTGILARAEMAKKARQERDRKRIVRAASHKPTGPTPPDRVVANKKRFEQGLASGSVRKIGLKPTSPESRRAAQAVSATLEAREQIQRGIMSGAHPEGIAVLRRQAEAKYREAQKALKASGVRRRVPGQAVTPPTTPQPGAPMPQPQPQPQPTKSAPDSRGNKHAVLRALIKDQVNNNDAIGRAYDRHGPDSPEYREAVREYDRVERQIGQIAGATRSERREDRRRKLAAQQPPEPSALEQRKLDQARIDRWEREGFEQSAPSKPKTAPAPKPRMARPAPRPTQEDPIVARHAELAKERAQIHQDHARAIQTRKEHGSSPEIEQRLDQIRDRANRNRVELMTIQGHHGKHLHENGAQLINLTSPYIDPAWRGSPARGGGRAR